MTHWTPCPILVGEPDPWDLDECSRRRRLSGVAQGVEDLRAVATHFKRDPDEAVAAWEAYAREADDDGMATFNAFCREWETRHRLETLLTIGQAIAQGIAAGFAGIGLAASEAFQPFRDAMNMLAASTRLRQTITAALGDPELGSGKPPRLCYRCAEAHGDRPCRQAMRGRALVRR